MEPIAGWNFEPEMFPQRQRQSGFKRFVSKMAYYSGKTVGKVLGCLGNLILFPLGAYNLGRRVKHWWANRSGLQEEMDNSSIPGWDGAKWENKDSDPDQLNIDFRRVPEIWSYLTADKAEKEPGKSRAPVLSVYLSLPDPGDYTQLNDNDEFSDQDIDYAFALEKKEKNGLSDESPSGGKTSAAVYQSLILEQVFKGMKERDSGFISGKFSPCFCPILP